MQKHSFDIKRLIWAFVSLGVVLVDFFSKRLVLAKLRPIESTEIIPGVLDFTYVENEGAVFGILSDNRWVFLIISVVAIAALTFYCSRAKRLPTFEQICVGMILGGGIGNMIDRIFYGFVVDFINVICFDFWSWVFNIADAAIDVGAILLIIYILFFSQKSKSGRVGKDADNNVNT